MQAGDGFADQAVIAVGVREREDQVARQLAPPRKLWNFSPACQGRQTPRSTFALSRSIPQSERQGRGCQFGQLWYPEPGTDVIKCLANSYFGYPLFAESHSSSAKLELKKGDQSIPGWVWQHRAPLWIEDFGKSG